MRQYGGRDLHACTGGENLKKGTVYIFIYKGVNAALSPATNGRGRDAIVLKPIQVRTEGGRAAAISLGGR